MPIIQFHGEAHPCHCWFKPGCISYCCLVWVQTAVILFHSTWGDFLLNGDVLLPVAESNLEQIMQNDVEFRRGLPINYRAYMGYQFKASHSAHLPLFVLLITAFHHPLVDNPMFYQTHAVHLVLFRAGFIHTLHPYCYQPNVASTSYIATKFQMPWIFLVCSNTFWVDWKVLGQMESLAKLDTHFTQSRHNFWTNQSATVSSLTSELRSQVQKLS